MIATNAARATCPIQLLLPAGPFSALRQRFSWHSWYLRWERIFWLNEMLIAPGMEPASSGNIRFVGPCLEFRDTGMLRSVVTLTPK
jgi:hypothetical protein